MEKNQNTQKNLRFKSVKITLMERLAHVITWIQLRQNFFNML